MTLEQVRHVLEVEKAKSINQSSGKQYVFVPIGPLSVH